MDKMINLEEYKKKKIEENNDNSLEECLLMFNDDKEKEDELFKNKITWFKEQIKEKKYIESNTLLLEQEDIRMLFWLTTKLYEYNIENYLDNLTTNDLESDVFISNFVLKIEDIFVNMKTVYNKENVTLICSLLEESEVKVYSDVEWIFNNIDHPDKEKNKNVKILEEIQNIAMIHGVSIEDIKKLI